MSFTGPLADGRAQIALDKMTEQIKQDIAQDALNKARQLQLANIKVEVTGAEPRSLHIERSTFGLEVTDLHSIKYGPWLEGDGSRNVTTRFKGYHSLAKAAQEVDLEAERKANDIARPYIAEMN